MAAKQAAVLWLTLLIGTLGFQSIALAVGVTLIAVVYTFTGRRPAERMLEKFLLTQLLMGVLLYILWRIIQPISVHDWYAKIEDVVLAQSADVLRVRLPLILGIVAAYLFMIDGGTRIVKGILGKFPGLYQRVVKALEEGDGNGEASPVSEENVGEWIGILERVITLTLVLTGNFTAIAFVLTAKSIARFKALEQSKDFAEYYLLGTSGSMIVALGVGMLVRIVFGL
jgi:hypothetical protein